MKLHAELSKNANSLSALIALVKSCLLGLALLLGVPCGSSAQDYNLTLLANVPQPDYGPRDIWGWVHPVDGREYALLCMGSSLDIYDVTNPSAPVLSASVPSQGFDLKDVKTMGRYAYIANQDGPIQVADLFYLPDSAMTVGALILPNSDPGAHNIFIDSVKGVAHLGMNGAGNLNVLILDLSDPVNPTQAAELDIHSVYCNAGFDETHDAWANGDTAFYAAFFGGILVVDVSDINNPSFITMHRYPNNTTHSLWGSVDHRYIFTTDETTGGHLRVFDVSNVHTIHQVGFYQTTPNAIIHNVHIRDTLAFISYYSEGVKVVSIANPEMPVEVASYDTFKKTPSGSFDGCWGVYPYLPSGTILASDRNAGLFVFSLTEVNHGWLAGRITDENGAPVPGARVNVLNTNLEGYSDADGNYQIPSLNGSGVISVYRSGYVAHFQSVTMAQNITTAFNPVLQTEAGANVEGYAKTVTGLKGEVKISMRNHFVGDISPDQNEYFNFGQALSGVQVLGAYLWGFKPVETLLVIENSPISLSIELELGYEDNFEWDQGWQVGDVNATEGVWERAAPYGTYNSLGTKLVQPDGDHGSGADKLCWMTGVSQPGVHRDKTDLDRGSVSLFSPPLDLTAYPDPHMNYWRWFSNDLGFNVGVGYFLCAVSNNGGQSWVTIDSTHQATTDWTEIDYRLSDFITPSANMKFKFTVNDLCATTTLEAAIDDFSVYGGLGVCCTRPGDANNDDRRNILDAIYLIDWLYRSGPQSACTEEMDADGDGAVLMADVTYIINWIFLGGPTPICP